MRVRERAGRGLFYRRDVAEHVDQPLELRSPFREETSVRATPATTADGSTRAHHIGGAADVGQAFERGWRKSWLGTSVSNISPRLGSTPEHNELTTGQRISDELRRKSRASTS